MINVLDVITAIRASFGSSIAIYTMGNCYQFYEILKTIFPDAEAFESGGHVFTKIDNKYYDIRGESETAYSNKLNFKPVTNDRIKSLSQNKWTDERRKQYIKLNENARSN